MTDGRFLPQNLENLLFNLCCSHLTRFSSLNARECVGALCRLQLPPCARSKLAQIPLMSGCYVACPSGWPGVRFADAGGRSYLLPPQTGPASLTSPPLQKQARPAILP